MDSRLGQNVAPDQLEAFLRDNADVMEERTFYRAFSPEETNTKEQELIRIDLELARLAARKKEIIAEIDGEIKPAKESHKRLVGELAEGKHKITERIAGFRYPDERMVGFYDPTTGILVDMRPMSAQELSQGSLAFKNVYRNTADGSNYQTGTDD